MTTPATPKLVTNFGPGSHSPDPDDRPAGAPATLMADLKTLYSASLARCDGRAALTAHHAGEEIRTLRARTLDLEAALDDLLKLARSQGPDDTAEMREAHRLLYPARIAR